MTGGYSGRWSLATRTGLKEPVLACFSPQHRLFYGGAVKNSYQPEQLR
jgi:hypothetical protein